MKIAGLISLGIGVFLFFLGMSTFFWAPVTGHLNDYSTSTTVQYGYSNTEVIASAYKGGLTTEWQAVNYNYEVENHKYNSSFIGFYLPFNNDLAFNVNTSYKKSITAYIAPYFSGISVIKRGFDLRLIGTFFLVGISILVIRARIITVYM